MKAKKRRSSPKKFSTHSQVQTAAYQNPRSLISGNESTEHS